MDKAPIFVTIDLDWASDEAVERTLSWFESEHVPVTVFVTHPSSPVLARMPALDVGLHPYFHAESSQGSTMSQVECYMGDLKWNVPIYRSHRFLDSNPIREAMARLGMIGSSNVCTDLSPVVPFVHRSTMLEIPIAFEDGSYLQRGYRLDDHQPIAGLEQVDVPLVLTVHPMHFVLNSPTYAWMRSLKDRTSRKDWRELDATSLDGLANDGIGIGSFVRDWVLRLKSEGRSFSVLRELLPAR